MKTGFIIIDSTGRPVGIVESIEPYLEMLEGLGITYEIDDDDVYRLYNPSHDLLARIHKIEIGF